MSNMIGKLIELKPINSRFKRLIADFGKDWICTNSSWSMPCFNGEIGVTARPCNNHTKLSNFKVRDVT